MAFSPISLPIQEILLSNFVTDIATISNANDLLLKDKVEDLINLFEIDLNTLSIGTDSPINYVKAQTFIIQDTGFIFQTGAPTQIIARLEKNINAESLLTVNNINVDFAITSDSLDVNDLVVNTSTTINGDAIFTSQLSYGASLVESKESVILNLEKSVAGTEAVARLTLTSTSRKNIFVKLKATTSPTLNFVYDGVSAFAASINTVELYIDFDTNNPPTENSTFNIHVFDVMDQFTSTSILSVLNTGTLPLKIKAGTNLSTSTAILLHNNTGNVGVNPQSTNFAGSAVLSSNFYSKYGHNISLLYILDENTADRLIITGKVGMEFF
jgi:hypothetical protein